MTAHQTLPATIPADVARLVVAAREAGFEDPSPERMAELIAASEAFANRVPWDDEPEDAAELRAVAPPATQPISTVASFSPAARECLATMYDENGSPIAAKYIRDGGDIAGAQWTILAMCRFAATLHTPPPVATATVVDVGWQTPDSAPFDTSVLVDCSRFEGVVEAVRYRSGGWKTFGPNGAFRCDPIAWREKPARSATPTPPAGSQ